MITFFVTMIILFVLLGIGFRVTGAVLSAAFWLLIKLPLAFILWGIGLVCCCTLILIPVGIGLFKAGISLMIPGCLV